MDMQYRTKGGLEVRIYATDAGGALPVHGAIRGSTKWFTAEWTKEGHAPNRNDERHDLIEVRQPITVTFWLVHRTDDEPPHIFVVREQAWQFAKDRVALCSAISGPHTVEYTEGEGL